MYASKAANNDQARAMFLNTIFDSCIWLDYNFRLANAHKGNEIDKQFLNSLDSMANSKYREKDWEFLSQATNHKPGIDKPTFHLYFKRDDANQANFQAIIQNFDASMICSSFAIDKVDGAMMKSDSEQPSPNFLKKQTNLADFLMLVKGGQYVLK